MRGLKRQQLNLNNYIESKTSVFPNPQELSKDNEWELKLSREFLNSSKVRLKIKRNILQRLINRAIYLVQNRPLNLKNYKVFVLIRVNHFEISGSRILITSDYTSVEDYIEKSEWYSKHLTPVTNKKLLEIMSLQINELFYASEYQEQFIYDKEKYEYDICFLGER